MNWASLSHTMLRMAFGFLFIPHGLQKLFGVLGKPQATDALHWAAGSIELIGGLMILVGFQTRWAAFICSGMMFVAYWMAHGTQAVMPIVNRGEPALLYCFAFFFLWGNGGGPFSVDAKLGKK